VKKKTTIATCLIECDNNNILNCEEYVLECGFSGMPIQLIIIFKKTIEIPENE
jgi:hypothetical protein